MWPRLPHTLLVIAGTGLAIVVPFLLSTSPGYSAGRTPGDEEVADSLARGEELYTEKCSGCHRLYRPKRFKRARWERVLMDMKPQAKLTQPEYEYIRSFLLSRSRDATAGPGEEVRPEEIAQ
ncbi:MAG: hypothetical protein IT282_14990 [Bacteroidetes bacterium]|nr:hypothetical protein [Bacteroidota bacterium]